MAKEKRTKASPREVVTAALRYYDREFYAKRLNQKQARAELRAVGVEAKEIARVASECCEFWRCSPNRVRLCRHEFDASEWHKMAAWIKTEGRIDPVRDTVLTVAARMRLAGIKTTVHAARESLWACGVKLPEQLPAFTMN